MLKELFIKGYFNYKTFVYENALSLGLTPNDTLVLLFLLDSYLKGNKKIDVDAIENKILLHRNDINNSLSNLLENSFYNVVLVDEGTGLEEQISIEPFLKKVEDFYKDEDKSSNKKIFTLIEKKSKRLLSAADYENINNLISVDNYTYNDFVSTINYLEKAKLDITVRNIIKYIEKKPVDNKTEASEAEEEFVKNILAKLKKKND